MRRHSDGAEPLERHHDPHDFYRAHLKSSYQGDDSDSGKVHRFYRHEGGLTDGFMSFSKGTPGSFPNFNNPDCHKIDLVMVRFECDLCGKCCASFGEFITMERQITAHDYFCRYTITNELFQAHVLPEYADEFADRFEEMQDAGKDIPPKGCVFTRKNPEGPGFVCIIYPSRPTICREFICYRMLINHRESGELRGKVIGINELRTQDGILAAIWKDKIAALPHPFESNHRNMQHPHAQGAEKTHGHDPHVLAHIYGREHADDRQWIENVKTVLAAHGYVGNPVE